MNAPALSARPSVVIVGAGFGGLAAARALAHAAADVTVIDRRNYHLFQPLLYQVATAALSPADIAWPIRGVLGPQANARVVMGRVASVDPDRREVATEDGRRFAYDYLVLATGARHAYFGNDDWAATAPGLKKIDDATAIRARVLTAFELAEECTEPEELSRLLTFVVIGGGPTGVELAGALAELARQALTNDFRRIDPSAARVVLVEAGPHVLPAFHPELSARAGRALQRLGVELWLGTPVNGCDEASVSVGERVIGTRTVLWAAGVAASPAAKWLGVAHDRAGRVVVGPDLSVPGNANVFAIGDTAVVRDADGHAVPGVAPAAKQMGRHVGRIIASRIRGRSGPARAFRYRDAGSLATIGRGAAVAEIAGFRLWGLPAWLLWAVMHVWFLIGVRNRLVVAATWAWTYLTHKRGARLITGEPLPAPDVTAPAPQSRTA